MSVDILPRSNTGSDVIYKGELTKLQSERIDTSREIVIAPRIDANDASHFVCFIPSKTASTQEHTEHTGTPGWVMEKVIQPDGTTRSLGSIAHMTVCRNEQTGKINYTITK